MPLSPRTIPVCIPLRPTFKDLENLLSASSDSDSHGVLAHRVWYLHVGLLVLVTSAASRK
jgi:hypothetical protein